MSVQVITRDGEAEYAVLPWAEYQALLQAAGRTAAAAPQEPQGNAVALSELVALREAQGLSQADLARAVGISPHYLNLFESGERQPDGAILRALGRVLGVSAWEQGS
ncbi:helix-turn-helix domain-containing protein [Pseudomonas sp. J452]|uniref:helix-turn-helix domain-containing protein n=1 Tax=Pseudomonas sp. J452 TaxID=2898441 RepID=UPI0021ADFE4F|nr:helix-turn-helix transcriptional regulator [Pseudomonas sp. J452]UUY08055.1 helix-turn-helix domain-containing protein [Pseudomonas sp. J452]